MCIYLPGAQVTIYTNPFPIQKSPQRNSYWLMLAKSLLHNAMRFRSPRLTNVATAAAGLQTPNSFYSIP